MESSVFGGSSWTVVAGVLVISYCNALIRGMLQQRRKSRIEASSFGLWRGEQ